MTQRPVNDSDFLRSQSENGASGALGHRMAPLAQASPGSTLGDRGDAHLAASQGLGAEVEPGDSLTVYLRNVRRLELFTPQQEYEFATLAKAGDFEARQRMIEHNLRLVVSLAKGYAGRGVPLVDLIEEGNLGLMHAIDKFEPERGFRFSTYATWWIRQAVERALIHQGRAVRLPVNVVRKLHQVLRARRVLERDSEFAEARANGVQAMDVAAFLGRDTAEVMELLALAEAPRSLDVNPAGREGDQTLGESLMDTNTLDPSDLVQGHEVEQLLQLWLDRLSDREQEILTGRFGLHDREPETLNVLSDRLGLTRERIRQVQNEALNKLRRDLARSGIPRQDLL